MSLLLPYFCLDFARVPSQNTVIALLTILTIYTQHKIILCVYFTLPLVLWQLLWSPSAFAYNFMMIILTDDREIPKCSPHSYKWYYDDEYYLLSLIPLLHCIIFQHWGVTRNPLLFFISPLQKVSCAYIIQNTWIFVGLLALTLLYFVSLVKRSKDHTAKLVIVW